MTPKITASVGRPLGVLLAAAPRGPRHRGVRLRRQPAADLRRRSQRCELRHRGREEPFHAAARPCLSSDGRFRHPRRVSRNPQSNNPGRQQMVPSQSFPQTIVINEAGSQQRNGGREPQRGCDDRAAGGSEQRRARASARRRRQHIQGRVRAGQDLVVERQRSEGAGHADERDGRVRGKSPERHAAQPQRQLRHAWRRCGEPAVLPARHQLGDEHLHGRRQGQVRLHAVEHEPPDERRRPVHRGVHVRQNDRTGGGRPSRFPSTSI